MAAWCLEKEQELLERLPALPDGEPRAEETKRMIDRGGRLAGTVVAVMPPLSPPSSDRGGCG